MDAITELRMDTPANYLRAGLELTLVNVNGATYRVVRKGNSYTINGRKYHDGCTFTVIETYSDGGHGGVWFKDCPVEALKLASACCKKGSVVDIYVDDYLDINEVFLKMTRDIDDNSDSPLPF